jgi:hypothetical protein
VEDDEDLDASLAAAMELSRAELAAAEARDLEAALAASRLS